MVEWLQMSLRPDIICGKTWGSIIKLSVQVHLGESVSIPPKLGHFDLHFMLHWLWLSFSLDWFSQILYGLPLSRMACRCILGGLSAPHPLKIGHIVKQTGNCVRGSVRTPSIKNRPYCATNRQLCQAGVRGEFCRQWLHLRFTSQFGYIQGFHSHFTNVNDLSF